MTLTSTTTPDELNGSFGIPVSPSDGDTFSDTQEQFLSNFHLVNEYRRDDGTSIGEVVNRPSKAELEAHDLEIHSGELQYAFEKPTGERYEIYEQKVIDSEDVSSRGLNQVCQQHRLP